MTCVVVNTPYDAIYIDNNTIVDKNINTVVDMNLTINMNFNL